MNRIATLIALCVLGSATLAPSTAHPARAGFQANPTVTIDDVTVTEGNAGTVTATFTVTLSRPIDFPVSVNYATEDESATTANNDYVATTGSVSFGLESPLTRTVNVPVVGDTTDEPDEAFHVILTTTSDILVFDPLGVGTILDDDDQPPPCTYGISPTSQSFPPAGGTGTVDVTTQPGCAWTAASNDAFITVNPDSGGSGDGTVAYAVAANADPTPRTGTMTIAGQTFTVTQDAADVGPLSLSISDDMVIEGSTGVTSIFTVRLSQPSDAEVRVDYQTADGSGPSGATAPEDYHTASGTLVFPPHTTAMTVRALVHGDTADEPDEQFFVDLDNAVGAPILDGHGVSTIVNDDGDVTCTYDISPTSQSVPHTGGTGTVAVTAPAGCAWIAVSTTDFITVTSGSSGMGSGTVEFSVAASPDGAARRGVLRIAGHEFVVRQEEDGFPIASIDDVTVTEGDSGTVTALFTVRVSHPSDGILSISYQTRNGTATGGTNGGDFRSTSGNLRFGAGDPTVQTIAVPVYGDEDAEVDEVFFVDLSSIFDVTIADPTGMCTILNDDAPCEFAVTPQSLSFTASAGSQSVHVSTLEECVWGTSTDTPWIAVSPDPSGQRTGPGDAVVSVTGNLGAARTGTVTIAGQTVTVHQEGGGQASCDLTSYGGTAFVPTNVTVQVFDPTCNAMVDDCQHLAGVLARFTVVNQQHGGDLSHTVPLDERGIGRFVYTRDVATTDTVSVSGVTNEGLAFSCEIEVTWFENTHCPITAAVTGAAGGDAALAASRKFRDNVLAESERGRRYTALYYRFSGEAIRILMFNPMLMLRSREILERYRSVVEAMAEGREVTLTRGDLDEIESFLNAFGDRGSAELRDAIRDACRDLRDPAVHSQFRMRVTAGPRREMPARGSGLANLDGFPTSGLFLLLPFAAPRRRKAAREPSNPRRLAALAAVALALAAATPSSRASIGASARDRVSRPGGLAFVAGAGAVDPRLAYSTYLGGAGDDEGNAVAVDGDGDVFVVGFTDSSDFPTASGAQPGFGGGQQDAFVTKLDASGAVVYSTYLGGALQDNAGAVAVDADGNAYVTGFTASRDFPVRGAMQTANAGLYNAFVAKLDPSGALVASTYLGGSAGDFGSSIALDGAGHVYVAGVATSPDFPLAGALQPAGGGAADVFVAKLDTALSGLDYATYLGGTGNDGATSLAVGPDGEVYVAGVTSSPNFPTARPIVATFAGGLFDGFVARLAPTGERLDYSTYLGGSDDDRVFRIAVDAAGAAYVAGESNSTDLPTVRALQPSNAGGFDAFVAKIEPAGASLAYATYLGGSGLDGATALAVDGSGSAVVTGFTDSADFPSANALQRSFGGGSFDAFATRLDASGAALVYATYLGGGDTDAGFGVAVDAAGTVRVMGQTVSRDFPTSHAAQQEFGGGASDVFLSAIAPSGPTIAGASLRRRRLVVTGEGFDSGATLFVDGVSVRTRNDPRSPTTSLRARAGHIGRGQTVRLVVRNASGAVSPEFRFTRD